MKSCCKSSDDPRPRLVPCSASQCAARGLPCSFRNFRSGPCASSLVALRCKSISWLKSTIWKCLPRTGRGAETPLGWRVATVPIGFAVNNYRAVSLVQAGPSQQHVERQRGFSEDTQLYRIGLGGANEEFQGAGPAQARNVNLAFQQSAQRVQGKLVDSRR